MNPVGGWKGAVTIRDMLIDGALLRFIEPAGILENPQDIKEITKPKIKPITGIVGLSRAKTLEEYIQAVTGLKIVTQ